MNKQKINYIKPKLNFIDFNDSDIIKTSFPWIAEEFFGEGGGFDVDPSTIL